MRSIIAEILFFRKTEIRVKEFHLP